MKSFFHEFRKHLSWCVQRLNRLARYNISVGRHLADVPLGTIVFFPCQPTFLCCGLSGLVAIKGKNIPLKKVGIESVKGLISRIEESGLAVCLKNDFPISARYLGGPEAVEALLTSVRALKRAENLFEVASSPTVQDTLAGFAGNITRTISAEEEIFKAKMGRLPAETVAVVTARLEDIKDAAWCLHAEILENIRRIEALSGGALVEGGFPQLKLYKEINTVLNGIDRLEVRGRDSAGVSIFFHLTGSEFESFKEALGKRDGGRLLTSLTERSNATVLLNRHISIQNEAGTSYITVTFTYKVAAEIGSLGDNIRFLRSQIAGDRILQVMAGCSYRNYTISSHTRWASVGAICEANCHPVDNRKTGPSTGIIHACLNGDIDNYIELKREVEETGGHIPEEITTDTKIIPLQIEKYVNQGFDIQEAFRSALNDFEGSHAIAVQTDLAPGKLFLAQRGSGQAIFVGLAEDHYISTSEVYGFVEETQRFLKLNGEKVVEGNNGPTQGQIFVLDQNSGGGLAGISAMYYDGTPIELMETDIKNTALTGRDIDRQGYPHYFLKEISEAPSSVEKTLLNRWKIEEIDGHRRYFVALDERMFPRSIRDALTGENGVTPIRRIFFVGQGTAGVAAKACADILNHYVNDPGLSVNALKSSELSGFRIDEGTTDTKTMADTLVVAISQSGTTTDTNRAIDMVRAKGAHSIAIVNRRDSDLTFKTNGVFYTSSGRDIEMSVASTKAFYSQIIAGALLALQVAALKQRRTLEFISDEILHLLEIPGYMRKILAGSADIEASARRLAPTKTYWAVVGSGPNKASADEIRIKLSELCYKTISSDYVEDKKHIDLSSEPLVIVCAAGTRPEVLGDIIKDTAIFKAHKATPVVIADEGENRFGSYADDVFHVPAVSQHLAPILNTLVGHIWGYHAALAIHDGSRFLYEYRKQLQEVIDEQAAGGLDIFEVILDKTFRETVASFYNEIRMLRRATVRPTPISEAANIILLLKYLSGRLPAADFELDFGKKGTASNMLHTFFEYVGKSINAMARPVDAIKHQAKTVTVGTSRMKEKVEGILFDQLIVHQINLSQLINHNIFVLKNLQAIVSEVKGSILYRIDGLNLLGEPMEDSTIEIIRKTGVLEKIPSRVETDRRLKGTKRIIVRQGNVYIGKGRKDDRSIIVIPIISTSPEMPNRIEFLLLLNIGFKPQVPLDARVKALGGKHEHIKNIVQENSLVWEDKHLDLVEMDELFGRSAEKIGEFIVSRLTASANI